MKKILLLATILLFALSTGIAGDLISIKIIFDDVVYEDADPEIVAKYSNQNPSFSVTGITYNFGLYSLESSELIYSKEVEGEDVKPGETVSINFGKLETSGLEYNKLYIGKVTTEVDFDEDPSNNEGTFEFEYRSKYYNLELKLDEYYATNGDLDINTPAYVHDMAIGVDYEFKSAFGEESFKPKSASFVGWIDLMPNAYYSHPTIMYSYDIEKDELNTIDANWYPIIKDSESNELITNDILVYGEEQEITEGETDFLIGTGEGQKQKERVCALLVSGTDKSKKRVNNSFKKNVEIMKDALKNKTTNSGLTDENIRVENGISGEALYNILVSMVGKYDKVYFYYSGHMDSTGVMITSDEPNGTISGGSIIEAISEINAKENCIVWESCFSGLMVDEVAHDYLFEKSNVTLVTSSTKDKESYANYAIDKKTKDTIGYGAFTASFTSCYVDSLADKNKDTMVTLSEAYNWLKKNKPKGRDGRDIDSLQGFQMIRKSKGKVIDNKISFEGTGVVIYEINGSNLDEDYTVSVSVGEHDLKSTNNKITDISNGRMWNIESTAENGNFKVDLEVQLDPQYEMLNPMSPNILGMVWRENETEVWQPQYPSLYNKDDNTITCPGVDHFSDWAVGIISANPTSVDSKFLVNNVEYGPNPFKNMLNFEFNLDEPEVFSIEVVDITGKQIDYISERQYNRGSFNVNLDGSKYISGTYYCRLVSANGLRNIKLVKE